MSETISQLPLAAQANAADLIPATQGSSGPQSGITRAVTPAQILAVGPPVYTVSGLPSVAPGTHGFAFASNGRNSGEGSGSGTGCQVYLNSAGTWFACWSGLAVTA